MTGLKRRFLVCDVDGSLVDRMDLHVRIFVKMCLKWFGIYEDDIVRDRYLGTAGMSAPEQLERLLYEREVDYTREKLDQAVEHFFTEIEKETGEMYPGAKDTLQQLHEAGVIILATTGLRTQFTVWLFEQFGIGQYFHMVHGSERVPKSGEHIVTFADELHMSLEDFCGRAVIYGDGPRDMEIGAEYGLLSVGNRNTVPEKLFEAGADLIVKDITILPCFFLDHGKKIAFHDPIVGEKQKEEGTLLVDTNREGISLKKQFETGADLVLRRIEYISCLK